MWICFNNAFVSVVADQHSDGLMVRARKRQHLTPLFGPKTRIIETPKADYRWRVIVTRKQVADLLSRQVNALSYINFKATVADKRLHNMYLTWWSDHHRMQEDAAAAKPPRIDSPDARGGKDVVYKPEEMSDGQIMYLERHQVAFLMSLCKRLFDAGDRQFATDEAREWANALDVLLHEAPIGDVQ